VHTQSAGSFFSSVKEESSMDEVIGTLGKRTIGNFALGGLKTSQLERTIQG
jgi:hypothetical protein